MVAVARTTIGDADDGKEASLARRQRNLVVFGESWLQSLGGMDLGMDA